MLLLRPDGMREASAQIFIGTKSGIQPLNGPPRALLQDMIVGVIPQAPLQHLVTIGRP